MKLSNLIVAVLLLMVGCSNDTPEELKGGWFLIDNKNEIIGNMLFSKRDVDMVWIDSSYVDGKNVYKITGCFTPDATVKLSAFTEQNIGKRLGFALDEEVITSEFIEWENDKRRFFIISANKSKVQRVYESLLIGNIFEP